MAQRLFMMLARQEHNARSMCTASFQHAQESKCTRDTRLRALARDCCTLSALIATGLQACQGLACTTSYRDHARKRLRHIMHQDSMRTWDRPHAQEAALPRTARTLLSLLRS